MSTLMQYFSMGKYTYYVWPAYGVVVGMLLLQGLNCRLQKERIKKSLKIWFKQTQRL